jgi:hypothetical protein
MTCSYSPCTADPTPSPVEAQSVARDAVGRLPHTGTDMPLIGVDLGITLVVCGAATWGSSWWRKRRAT